MKEFWKSVVNTWRNCGVMIAWHVFLTHSAYSKNKIRKYLMGDQEPTNKNNNNTNIQDIVMVLLSPKMSLQVFAKFKN